MPTRTLAVAASLTLATLLACDSPTGTSGGVRVTVDSVHSATRSSGLFHRVFVTVRNVGDERIERFGCENAVLAHLERSTTAAQITTGGDGQCRIDDGRFLRFELAPGEGVRGQIWTTETGRYRVAVPYVVAQDSVERRARSAVFEIQ